MLATKWRSRMLADNDPYHGKETSEYAVIQELSARDASGGSSEIEADPVNFRPVPFAAKWDDAEASQRARRQKPCRLRPNQLILDTPMGRPAPPRPRGFSQFRGAWHAGTVFAWNLPPFLPPCSSRPRCFRLPPAVRPPST